MTEKPFPRRVDLYTITTLRQAAAQGRVKGAVHVQVEALQKKETKEGKPFYELSLADAEGKFTLRAWSDAPTFALCASLRPGGFTEIRGEFSLGNFGLDSRDWNCRDLTPEEKETLLAGPAELRAKQAADFDYLTAVAESFQDPRLLALGRLFFAEYAERFRRTGAARHNHHARRGGLVEHVAQMMRSAEAVAATYPWLNRDLLCCGVLFHDVGKLWENVYLADGFSMPFTEGAELLGHIPIGIEIVNMLWRRLAASEEAAGWVSLLPETDQVRLHLLHLIASHHGELQFGSPVVPKTPEAWALHHVDNLDAKLEMFLNAYGAPKPQPGSNGRVIEKVWPLATNLVIPLARFHPLADGEENA